MKQDRAAPLTQRLSGRAPLTGAEYEMLAMLNARGRRTVQHSRRLNQDGAPLAVPLVLMTGWACRARELDDGARQIIDLFGPGDIISLTADIDEPPAIILALTTIRVTDAPELRAAHAALGTRTGLRFALDSVQRDTEAFLINQIVRLGRQDAYDRLAHLFVEIEARLDLRGLSAGGSFDFNLTQEMIADLLGLSVVHVNRTLQQMRREGMLTFSRGRVELLDRPMLVAAADFRPRRVRGSDLRESG